MISIVPKPRKKLLKDFMNPSKASLLHNEIFFFFLGSKVQEKSQETAWLSELFNAKATSVPLHGLVKLKVNVKKNALRRV